ncbi:14310_t:CDS:2, partial [Cetraspora pellucida]
AKDAFEDFSINGNVKKYGYDELTKIFWQYLSIHVFSKTKEEYYHFVKMRQVEIPLFQSKPEQVYELMQLLLELWTAAVIKIVRMLFYQYKSRHSKKPNKGTVYGIKQIFVTIGTPKGNKKR